jgi:tRNA wybutosine-synthesizing protein 3
MSIPLDWLRPIENDDREEILASFADLQQTTRNTLYGNGHDDDKSPKGSVDAPIRPLVDLINRHSAICTLSSCSGRISLFDPNTRASTSTGTSASSNKSKSTEQSGKGRGGWVLVNHDLVDSSELLECFADASNDTATTTPTYDDQQPLPWIFKLEPMLMHVAARSLKRGQELLRLALELGFRESGLVVTDRRVTVAIRSHSLSLALPLTPQGPLRPPNAYLGAVLEQANQRLLLNWKQLDRLYQAIESKLFRVSLQPVVKIETTLPPLNLWNAATIAWPREDDDDDDDSLDIFAFAGYGTGPNASHPSSSSKRTSTIYQLSRSREGLWSDQWEPVQLVLANETADQPVVVWPGGLEVSLVSQLPQAQGMTACRLEKWILLWGGRTSPSKPLDTIYLFDPETRQLATPHHVHGEAPPPRWGHSFVALSQNRMALTGGCNAVENRSLDDFYVLHFGPNAHFYWERVTSTPTMQLPTGRFHAATIVQENDTLLVLGGLGSTEHALAPFEAMALSKEGSVRACRIGETRRDGEQCHTTVRPLDVASPQTPRFGAAACTLGRLVVVSGGIESSNSSNSIEEEVDLPPLECSIVQVNSINGGTSMAPVPFTFESDEVVDFGSLVHHSCLSISDREFILLGGGVPSFAFGDLFAASYHVRIDLSCSETSADGNRCMTLEQPSGTTTKMKSTNKKSSPSEAKSAITNVLYVAPVDAKRLKSELESRSLLDKGFRMIKLSSGQIAVPVTVQAAAGKTFQEETSSSAAEGSWKSCIVGQGKEEMPFSTAQFAARGKR